VNGALTGEHLRQENHRYTGTGGISAGNRAAVFTPAFCDTDTGRVVPSRLADGSPSPVHLLAGLPPEWVVARGEHNQILAVKATVVAGFLLAGSFYNREEAAQALALH